MPTNEINQIDPSTFKKWLIAARPWALPASTMPVLFGTSLAVVIGKAAFLPLRFLLALLGMMVLHSAANMLSDVFDFRRGLDKVVTPVSGAIVRGWLDTRAVTIGAVVLFIAGASFGLWLVFLTGPILLIIGGFGILIGIFYAGLKYHALGDFAVFLNFGILGSLGAWAVQTGTFSWLPVFWTIPMATLVSAILHANNWRDMESDREKKVFTLANIFGDSGSLSYYLFLLLFPFFFILVLIFLPRLFLSGLTAMPLSFLILVLALPKTLQLWQRARLRKQPKNPLDFIILDGATAQYNLLFGLLCTVAVWLHLLLVSI